MLVNGGYKIKCVSDCVSDYTKHNKKHESDTQIHGNTSKYGAFQMATIPLNDSRLKNRISEVEAAIIAKKDKIEKNIADGRGLSLQRQDGGSWLWFYRFRIGGRASRVSLGAYPVVSLAQARELHRQARELVNQGINPAHERTKSKAVTVQAQSNTFEAVARAWWDVWRVGKQNKQALRVWRFLEKNALSKLGTLPISQITPIVVVSVIDGVVKRGAYDVAGRVAIYLRKVFDYAIVRAIISVHPMASIDLTLIIPARPVQNHIHVPLEEVGQLLRDIAAYEVNTLHRIALQLIALTFVRNAELRGARWADFDLKNKLWTIPAGVYDDQGQKIYGMKKSTVHYVPLSRQAIVLLKELHAITGGGVQLFPSVVSKSGVISDALNDALERMGYKGRQDVHGFRGIAKKALVNYLNYPSDLAALQQSRMNESEVERAYGAKLHIPERIAMMQAWADCLDDVRDGKRTMREIPLNEQIGSLPDDEPEERPINKVKRSKLKVVR